MLAIVGRSMGKDQRVIGPFDPLLPLIQLRALPMTQRPLIVMRGKSAPDRRAMMIDDNGPENAYQGPAEPGSEEDVYDDIGEDGDKDGNRSDDIDIPENPPVDEAEEPSPGSSA
jgi:hypothetical protein